jgi:NADPH-dependent curcumin reductase CurA
LAYVPGEWRIVAALVCGGVALSAHGLKAGARAALNTSPEPVTNWIASLAEDGFTALLLFLAVRHPLAAALVAGTTVVLAAALGAWIWRALRRFLARRRPVPA